MRLKKVYDLASFKALPDDNGQTGRFEALVSVFGNVDLQGDRVIKGAFEKSIKRWQASGDPVPVLWSHEWADPFAHIGAVNPEDMQETSKGLLVRGTLDIHKPFAAQVYDLLKSRRVKEWSFSYDVVNERPGSDRANELVELDIHELGPALKGANSETETVAVKSVLERAAKVGRVFSAKNEQRLREAHDLAIQASSIVADVLSSLERVEDEKPIEEQKSDIRDGEEQAQGEAPVGEQKAATPQDDENKKKRDELIQRIRMLTMDVA